MFNDENKSSSLAKFLNGFDYVIVDTCSLMEDSFPAWMDVLVNAKDYLREDLHIQVLNKCVDELKKHSKNRQDDSARIAAKRALKILRKVKWKKILELTKKEKDQNFADNVIYTTVSNLRIHYKVLIITQDKGLAEDLRRLNLLDSQRGRKVATYKLLPEGTLDVNRGQADHYHQNHKPSEEDEARLSDKPSFSPAKKEDPNELLNKVIANDKKLRSDLNNSTYSKESKLKDIDAQLAMVLKLPEDKKKTLKLLLNDARLHEEKTKLLNPGSSVLEKIAEPAKLQPKPTEKFVEAIKIAPESKPTVLPNEKRLWFGEGYSIAEAIKRCSEHYGILFRDHTIPYVKQVHGPYDVTDIDLKEILDKLSALADGKSEFLYKGVLYKAQKSEKGFKGYIDLNPNIASKAPQEEKPASTPLPKPEDAAPKAEAKPDVKPNAHRRGRPRKNPVNAAPVVNPAPASPTAPKPQQLRPQTFSPTKGPDAHLSVHKPHEESVAGPKGATLIVGVPDDDNKREFIERKSRRDAESSGGGKTAVSSTKPSSFNQGRNSRPQKQSVILPSKNAPSSIKPVTGPGPLPEKVRLNKPRPVQKPLRKNPPVVNPKQPQAAPAMPIKDFSYEAAAASEKRLMANLNNPNYPKENKAKDINAQLALIQKLRSDEVAKLRYSSDSLKLMLSLLK